MLELVKPSWQLLKKVHSFWHLLTIFGSFFFFKVCWPLWSTGHFWNLVMFDTCLLNIGRWQLTVDRLTAFSTIACLPKPKIGYLTNDHQNNSIWHLSQIFFVDIFIDKSLVAWVVCLGGFTHCHFPFLPYSLSKLQNWTIYQTIFHFGPNLTSGPKSNLIGRHGCAAQVMYSAGTVLAWWQYISFETLLLQVRSLGVHSICTVCCTCMLNLHGMLCQVD